MSDSRDSESSSTPPEKVPKKGGWTAKKKGETRFEHHAQKFRDEWLKHPMFRDWLEPDPKDSKKAKCAFCPASSLVAEITNLKSHAKSKKHLKNKPEFQSEKVVIHKLHDKIRDLYQEILLRFLKREYVMQPNITQVDPKNEQFMLNETAMYLGIKVYEMLKHPDVVRQPLKKTMFFINCRNFLRTGALKIKNVTTWKIPFFPKLQALGPASALSNDFRVHVPTLMPLIEVVPCIIASFDDTKKQQIDDQWRRLPIAKARHPTELKNTTEPDEFEIGQFCPRSLGFASCKYRL
ncbi:unnamed protein product [Parnassius apollo]|uniref:(apollo) hypothetical protein n=1 Tax=Parnassius apollo TaxID=110799 RepID=A0A8S3WF69_PARAO|nr:unnamed protein product [Parnassius apollo]